MPRQRGTNIPTEHTISLRRAVVLAGQLFLAPCLLMGTAGPVAAQQPAAPARPSAPASASEALVQPFVRNWTRVEFWNYFEPPPATTSFTPGDPTTAHVGNRLQAGLRVKRGRMAGNMALQYVQFGGLPTDAIGPGPLGTGATYFDHSGDGSAGQVYLKTATIAFRRIGGALDLQVGRMPFTSGAERASGVPTIEAVKRQRIDSRLVGEFEWAIFQRAFDGVRADWSTRRYQLTGTAFQPTQGGYEDAAGLSLTGVRVFSGMLTAAPGAIVPRSEVQFFTHHYRDTRRVTARPDNTGRSATRADVAITTVGGHLVGSRPAGSGEIDVMLWGAGQFGSWYEQAHGAFGLAGEAGYQWSKVRWQPWLRGGISWLSGDTDARDDGHGTFFPMLPTIRRYAQSTLYSMANLRDVSVQLMLRPTATVSARVDAHLLGLATSADGWYAGSGATQNHGRIFGYALRRSGGATRLMNVVEGSVDWRIERRWSVNAYVGIASAGPVVRATFRGEPAVFGYIEHVVQF